MLRRMSVHECIACVQVLFVRSLFEIAHCVGSFMFRENNTDQVQTQAIWTLLRTLTWVTSVPATRVFFHGILASRKLSGVFLSLQFVGDQNTVKARNTEQLLCRL